MSDKKEILIIGYGSFGTAMSILLAKKGYAVYITARNQVLLDNCKNEKENKKYLQVNIPSEITFLPAYSPEEEEISNDILKKAKEADVVLFAVPAQSFSDVFKLFKNIIKDDAIIVNIAKGIDIASLKRLSELAEEIKPNCKYVAVSGPSHAEEVAENLPTSVSAASKDIKSAEEVQEIFSTDRFRVYTNTDLIGVELGGALKNIIALGAGISDGLGFGDNAKAALITRGIVEITRLGTALGARRETFSGLSGIGDLIVTCTSMHSRNRRCGILIGEGMKPKEAIEKVGMVVEGAYTCEAAYLMAKNLGIEMPIISGIKACLDEKLEPGQAIDMLMTRSLKSE